MDRVYEDYFARRMDEITSFGPQLVFPQSPIDDRRIAEAARISVRDANSTLQRSTNRRLRADAQLFAELTLTELILRPVAVVRPNALQEVGQDAALDLRDVTLQASLGSDEQAVSAHRMIDALSGMWSQLRTARWELWD